MSNRPIDGAGLSLVLGSIAILGLILAWWLA
jgi:hypothetical protein